MSTAGFDEINQVASYLYLTSWFGLSLTELKKRDIQLIISVMDWKPSGKFRKRCKDQGIQTRFFEADDYESFDIMEIAQKIHYLIQDYRKEGKNVVVHCHAGISRSATVVMYHLLQSNRDLWQDDYTKYTSVEFVLKTLQSKRAVVNPNSGFIEQLKTKFTIPENT